MKYNYGECDICDAKLIEKRIKQDFWVRGKLVVIDHVPAGVCPQCGAKVVRAEVGRRISKLLEDQKKWPRAQVMEVPVVDYA